MSMIRLGAISLDCADPEPLGTFWADLLGGEIAVTREDISVVKLGDLLLTAMRVEDYVAPTWPTGSPCSDATSKSPAGSVISASATGLTAGS